MLSITSSDAKTRFEELLDRIASGESVVITRHGRPIARLVPIGMRDPTDCSAAIDRLARFGEGRTLGDLTLRALIDEGRR